MRDGRLRFVLAQGIGKAFLDHEAEPREVEAFLDRHG
jgi:3-dehydroquinate synthetase